MKKRNGFFIILVSVALLILWGLFSMIFVYCPAYYVANPDLGGVSVGNEPFELQFFLDDKNRFSIDLISPEIWIPYSDKDRDVCLKKVEVKLKRLGSPNQVIPISFSRDSLCKCNLPENLTYPKKDIGKQWSKIVTSQVCFENIIEKQYIFYITCNYYYKNKTYSKTEKFTLTRKGGGYELISKIRFGVAL